MKKFVLSCFAVGMVFVMTGCATTFVGEPKKPETPVVHVTHNHYYFVIVPEDGSVGADHRKQRGKGEDFSGGPRHREKVPGDPGARRLEYNHKKKRGEMPQVGTDHHWLPDQVSSENQKDVKVQK